MRSNYFKIIFTFLILTNYLQAQEKLPSDIANKIDNIFESYNGKPGIAVGVFKEGNILYNKGYGLANLDYDIPVTSETVFDLAAVSRPFTAACIYLLEIDGKINLNDPIQKYLPEIPVYKEGAITVSNLIHNTSGLREYMSILHSKGISLNSNIENNDALKLLSKQKGINFKPNSQHSYSYTGYLLLSEIVKRVRGESIGAFAKKRIFEPLGMTNTFFYENKNRVVKNRAIGYESDGDVFNQSHFFNFITTGDGGAYSTISDLFKWNENFKTGKVGGNLLIQKMHATEKLANGNNNVYAGGFYGGDYLDLDGFPSIRLSGYKAGSRSLFCKLIKQDLTFVILSNNANTNVWGLLEQLEPLFLEKEINIARSKLSNITNQETIKPYKIKKKELYAFAGNFLNIVDGSTRELVVKNDTLIYKRSNGRETKLTPIAKKEFIFLGMPFVKLDLKQKNTLRLLINENAPLVYSKYTPKSFTNLELNKYKGIFYSDEFDVNYEIKPDNGNLKILIDSKELLTLTPVAENIFNEEHFGYIKFNEDGKGNITNFIRYDNTLMDIKFVKKG